jgi:hypothetical protein
LSDETVVAALAPLFAAAAIVDAGMDASNIDISALAARLGRDPEAMFRFVRDEIRYEPYVGVLRGARGTLIGRAGNALDRSLLLAELLENAGFTAEIVSGRLAPAQAQMLLGRLAEPEKPAPVLFPDSPQLEQAFIAALGTPTQTMMAIADAAQRRGETITTELRGRAQQDAEFLRENLSGSGIDPAPAVSFERLLAEAAEHYWVRYGGPNGTWIELDSSFPDAAFGGVTGTASGTFARDAVPEERYHRLGVTVTLRTLGPDGAPQDRVLIDELFRIADRRGEGIVVANLPIPSPGRALLSIEPVEGGFSATREFTTTLQVGSGLAIGPFFDLQGKLYENASGTDAGNAERLSAGTEGGFGGATSALENLFAPAPKPAAAGGGILAQWADYRIVSPGLTGEPTTTQSFRRDILGPAGDGAPWSADQALPRLLWSAELLPISGSVPPEWVAHLQLRHIRENEAATYVMLRQGLGLPASSTGAVAPPARPLATEIFAATSDAEIRSAIETRFPELLTYVDRPLLLGFETQGEVEEGSILLRQGYDIMANGRRILARQPTESPETEAARQALRLFQAALDNALEWSLVAHRLDSLGLEVVDPPVVLNTGELFRAADAVGIDAVVLTAQSDFQATLAELGLPSQQEADLRAVLEAGHTVIVPRQEIALGGEPQFGWWQLSPADASLIGVMSDGRGAATTEQLALHEEIALTAFNLYGSFLNCLVGISGKRQAAKWALCLGAAAFGAWGAWGSMRGHLTFYMANVLGFFLIGLTNLANLEEKAGSGGDRQR